MHKNNIECSIKIVLLGESGVGKTNLLNTYCGQCFTDEYIPTIASSFSSKKKEIKGKNYEINMWDTCGQEKFRALTRLYMKNGEIFILVYDVTNSKSFEELNYWKEQVYDLVGKECIIGIIGNKCDLYLKEEVREE